jgi:SRSO17 transposase
MNLEGTEDSASRFAAYVGQVTGVIGHADRVRPLNDYRAGLLSQRAAGAWNRSQRSRPRPRLRCSKELAFSLPKRAWRTIA